MSSATVKRARVTARIAQAEHTSLPTSSENTQQLLEQTEGKRKQLDKKCGEYEQVCKKVAKLKAEKNRLETDYSQLTSQCDETDQMFTRFERSAETSFLTQQQKNNEMNAAMQQWTALDGKEEKLYDDLNHETELELDLREKCSQISRNVEQLGTEASANEKEYRELETVFDTDMKTEKTLEQYLARLIDDVFSNQRRLEDIHIGTSRGRANFRQAEKALRDQRRNHRRFSSQLSDISEADKESEPEELANGEERKQVDQLEDAWDVLQEKIRLKEFELVEESNRMNQRLAVLETKQGYEAEEEEKQRQLKIARDYANLQSHTPMYAAYSAALSLNHNLVEKLEIPSANRSSRSTWKETPLSGPTSSGQTSGLGIVKNVQSSNNSSRHNVEFVDELEQFPEYLEMMNNRKKILRATENEATRIMTYELKELEGIVSGQRQQAQALEKDVKWLKDSIQLRKADISFYSSKAEEIIEKARKEDQQKLQQRQHKSENSQLPMDLVASRCDVLEMRDRVVILESERNMLANQIKESNLECDRLNDQWKILKGFAKSVDIDSIRRMNNEIDCWRIKVDQLESQIEKLQRMENYASLANGQLRTNLALLKPYDEEYQEFESLVEANKRLNDQLARHEFRNLVEEAKQNGDIDVLSMD